MNYVELFKEMKDAPLSSGFLGFSFLFVLETVFKNDFYLPTAILALVYALVNYHLTVARKHEAFGEILIGNSRRRLLFFFLFSGLAFALWVFGTVKTVTDPVWFYEPSWLQCLGTIGVVYAFWIGVLICLGPTSRKNKNQ